MNTLLVGNGINNINNKQSWEQLLHGIIRHCKAQRLVKDFTNKPFPLLYEEIFLKARQKNPVDELALKRFIAQEVSKIAPNEIHARIREMAIDDVLTTNYDFTLLGGDPGPNLGKVKETRYSIFRHYHSGGKRWWHIHGDCSAPASINLGFEHYGGQLQYMRAYAASGVEYEQLTLAPLIRRMKWRGYKQLSWIDLFLSSDIYIVGLSLDFVETDLWWLLTWRARLSGDSKPTNTITYFIPKEFEQGARHKIDLFKANGVKVLSISGKDPLSYYHRVLDRV